MSAPLAPALVPDTDSTLPRSETSVRRAARRSGAEIGQGSLRLGHEASAALEHYKQRDLSKGPPTRCARRAEPCAVVVRFKATGNAPIMKQNFYKVRRSVSAALTQQITASNRFQTVIAFLRKELGSKPNESLVRPRSTLHRLSRQYLYINASFSPSPDDTVASLYKVRRSHDEARLTAAVLRNG